MKNLPLDEFGDIDPKKLTLEQNVARLKPLMTTLSAALKAQSLGSAQAAARELRRCVWAIEEGLSTISAIAREKKSALTLVRKDHA